MPAVFSPVSEDFKVSIWFDQYSKVFTKADKALYSVKQNGKDGLSFYIDETDSYYLKK